MSLRIPITNFSPYERAKSRKRRRYYRRAAARQKIHKRIKEISLPNDALLDLAEQYPAPDDFWADEREYDFFESAL
jgi:hypothetical protein